MTCPQPDRLIEQLAGEHGASTLARAEAHVQSCASCCTVLNAFVKPSDSFIRLIAQTEPASGGHCPDLESLACWCAGDPLNSAEAHLISLHLSGCEACAVLTAHLRLELADGAVQPFGGVFQDQNGLFAAAPAIASTSRVPVIAQLVGAFLLVLVSASIVLPKLDRLKLPRLAPATLGNALPGANPAESPLQAIFEFRLRESSETRSLIFPHYPGIQLSKDYEYAVHLTALRPGWILLFSVNPNQRLSLLLPARASSNHVPSLKTGGVMRFPSGSAWEPVSANSGRHRFYALYLDNAKAAEALVAESHRAEDTGASSAALEKELDEMVEAGGCASVSRPCVLTFEYDVF